VYYSEHTQFYITKKVSLHVAKICTNLKKINQYVK
jgi:hypothetical protein